MSMNGTLLRQGARAAALPAGWSSFLVIRPRVRRPALVRQDSPGA
ncbi:hypothetical protein [Streptomyces sp. B6B3]